MTELVSVAIRHLQHEISIPQDIANLMVPGEQPVAAYATFRDSAIFTTKRLIVRDAQGLRGKKVEVYSLPYSSINMWSSESAGSILDFTGELELWTRAGNIKISVDVRRLDMLIAMCVLRGSRPAGDKARLAKASNVNRNLCWGTVRAGVDRRGCGTCPLIARHVPELF